MALVVLNETMQALRNAIMLFCRFFSVTVSKLNYPVRGAKNTFSLKKKTDKYECYITLVFVRFTAVNK